MHNMPEDDQAHQFRDIDKDDKEEAFSRPWITATTTSILVILFYIAKLASTEKKTGHDIIKDNLAVHLTCGGIILAAFGYWLLGHYLTPKSAHIIAWIVVLLAALGLFAFIGFGIYA